MRRRDFLLAAGAGVAACALPSWLRAAEAPAAGAAPAGAATPPNIIFILADDVGLSDISCCGGDHFKTPNIDALAAGGTRFEYSYAMPLCGPSRCLALTGRYPFRTGLNSNHSADAIQPAHEVMLPTVMKAAGYATVQVGKWGQLSLGPGEWGFDEYLVFPGSGRYWREQTTSYKQNGKQLDLPAGQYLPDLMHDFLIDFIQRKQAQPFVAYYSMSHIHGPIVPTPDTKPNTPHNQLYADNIAYMDKLVGKLVAELDRLKLREKTVVVYAGDNGTARFGADTGTLGGRAISGKKASMLEGGSRVPLLVNWPGTTPAGAVNHDLTDFSDFLPTFAELGGAKLPAGVTIDGQSFAAQVKGAKGTPRSWVYVELEGKSYARGPRYKLTNSGALFDLKDAPFVEAPVPADTTDAEAIAARTALQAVLDAHPAKVAAPAPGGAPGRAGAPAAGPANPGAALTPAERAARRARRQARQAQGGAAAPP